MGGHGDKERGEPAGVIEVPVANEEVADLFDRNTRFPQPSEQDGAAGCVE
jgi:hypothetical protein